MVINDKLSFWVSLFDVSTKDVSKLEIHLKSVLFIKQNEIKPFMVIGRFLNSA